MKQRKNNRNGVRTIPMTEEMRDILDRVQERFRNRVGRDPLPDEPVFLLGLEHRVDDLVSMIADAQRELGIDPALIYAFEKCGLMVSESNIHLISKKDLREWRRAIKEYEDIQSGKIVVEEHPVVPIFISLRQRLETLIIIYKLAITKYSKRMQRSRRKKGSVLVDSIMFCFTKNLKTISAITLLNDSGYGEDGMNLTRTIFENYLEIVIAKYASDERSKQLMFEIGIHEGTHLRRGRFIVDMKTGEKVGLFNNFEKAGMHPRFGTEDQAVYEYLYDHLSSYTHLDLRTFIHYIDDKRGFSDLNNGIELFSFIYVMFLNFMILFEIQDMEVFKESWADIRRMLVEIGTDLSRLMAVSADVPPAIQDRIECTMKVIRSSTGMDTP